jgi:hypothetical protein
MKLDESVARACERIPGMLRGALVLLPDGILLSRIGGESALGLEPLIRAATRCFHERVLPALGTIAKWPQQPVLEYLFVIDDQLVVIQGGRRDPRLALAVACTREHTVGFVLTAVRLAMHDLEEEIDLSPWGL